MLNPAKDIAKNVNNAPIVSFELSAINADNVAMLISHIVIIPSLIILFVLQFILIKDKVIIKVKIFFFVNPSRNR